MVSVTFGLMTRFVYMCPQGRHPRPPQHVGGSDQAEGQGKALSGAASGWAQAGALQDPCSHQSGAEEIPAGASLSWCSVPVRHPDCRQLLGFDQAGIPISLFI